MTRIRLPGITGPTSALTDFLAAHNISAAEIRRTAEERRRLANQQQQEPAAQTSAREAQDAGISLSDESVRDSDGPGSPPQAGPQSSRSSTRRSARNKGKGKAKGKGKGKRKRGSKRARDVFDSSDSSSDGGGESDDSDILNALNDLSPDHPSNQREDCSICNTSFLVTPYSKAAPDGGLLCSNCSRKDNVASRPKTSARPAPAKLRKRKKEIMDRMLIVGGKSLTVQCIEVLVNHINLAESVSALPESMLDLVARQVAKRRLLNSKTLGLFIWPQSTSLYLYDAAKLTMDDLSLCFHTCTKLKKIIVRNGIQFKDPVMQIIIEANVPIESFSLHGGNLLSSDGWKDFFSARGPALKAIVVEYTDTSFSDDVVQHMVDKCPNLKHVSIRHSAKLTSHTLEAISRLKNLTSLSLQITAPIGVEHFCNLIAAVGPNLEVLSLRDMHEANNSLLDSIRTHCHTLRKLRINECPEFTDVAMANFFTNWTNPPLQHIDLYRCRPLVEKRSDDQEGEDDTAKPAIGPRAFQALIAHSASHLRYLNVASARHISGEAFTEAFNVEGGLPRLTYADLSFCEMMTNTLVEKLIAVAPQMQQIVAFGCLRLSAKLIVPRHVQVIGLANVIGMTLGAQTVKV
ncbi:hypothetical protein BROUX41_002157 [Berkeleyomyces rouxiae]